MAALKEVKNVGGIKIAQTPYDAEWSDMPERAIMSGYVDYVLSIEEIAHKTSKKLLTRKLITKTL